MHRFFSFWGHVVRDPLRNAAVAIFAGVLEPRVSISQCCAFDRVAQMLQMNRTKHKIEFKYYDQSSRCETEADSSVSYAAAVVTAL